MDAFHLLVYQTTPVVCKLPAGEALLKKVMLDTA